MHICFEHKDTNRLKLRGWKKCAKLTLIKEKAEVAILVSVKEDFRAKNITRDKRGSLHNENGGLIH